MKNRDKLIIEITSYFSTTIHSSVIWKWLWFLNVNEMGFCSWCRSVPSFTHPVKGSFCIDFRLPFLFGHPYSVQTKKRFSARSSVAYTLLDLNLKTFDFTCINKGIRYNSTELYVAKCILLNAVEISDLIIKWKRIFFLIVRVFKGRKIFFFDL